MMTVKEVSEIAGVSIRTLHYYDKIGLLCPANVTDSGYRLYDDVALERLQQILLFRELEFSLKEIKLILESDKFDREKALTQQIELLLLKKRHIEDLIDFAREVKGGRKNMDFKAFDTKKIEEYTKRAKEEWGGTDAYKEYEVKSKNRTTKETQDITSKFMEIFTEFGKLKEKKEDITSEIVQTQVKRLQDFITENFYTCTLEILQGLGTMYGADGEFTENIDRAGGEGCAEFTAKAIEVYCKIK